ncbi:hypothetical protein AWN76_011630 [Rhodothermaceae bacterium RA]|nr:hypothetical protein AWN76_011630 [Rhodothermaceae bacterium RA]
MTPPLRLLPGLLALTLLTAACTRPEASPAPADPDEEAWIDLFNGRDLTGWTPKIRGYPAGENVGQTFRVVDSLLTVAYDAYDTFDERFGHLFYETPFSHYRIAVEYRFIGEQAPGGPGWALRNSGIMIHGQPPETMGLDQDFPISIEVQLLGGTGQGERPTANLCTPGTHVVMNGELVTQHCINSSSRTYHGDQWVRVEVLVLGDSLIVHEVNGEEVLRYTRPQIGGGTVSGFDPAQKQDGRPLTGGTISLQSESHPVQFRSVRLLNLEGCTDPAALNYKRYLVASDPAACRYP